MHFSGVAFILISMVLIGSIFETTVEAGEGPKSDCKPDLCEAACKDLGKPMDFCKDGTCKCKD
uniref:Potassium channel toxin alpha-KTx 18.3 n=1 Tax=Tityus discrepans TaxID=57059 RepID=KA183_TITDI|nr:RecName: Full=Potassium channel toxin alpha-KTx 18.3; AltName: Full=Toxin TdK3; Flags: Precursor [Tityus discrepans]CAY61914.1 potassium channel toxin alpha-KTx 18.3 precursor [Tityus discrepans]